MKALSMYVWSLLVIMMMGFTSVNLTNIINTASINRNINSAVNSAVHSINDNVTEGVRSVNRKLDDKF